MTYLWGIGWDVPLDELEPFPQAPRNGEVQSLERRYGDGGVIDVGLFSEPIWEMLETDPLFRAILTQLGILDDDECKGTWYTLDDTLSWHRYNAIAVKPRPYDDGGLDYGFILNQKVVIKIVAQLEEP